MPSDSAPLVSVVIPSHNRPEMLADAIASVLAQTITDLEVVVVDDGSQPPVQLPPELAARGVRIVRHEQAQGVCAARNRGIEEARGRWVALLDDDDRWRPAKLARQLEALQPPARWSYTGCDVVNIDGEVERPFRREDLERADDDIISGNRIGTPSSVLAERALLLEAGGFSTHLSVLADWDMWIRLARLAPAAPVLEPLVEYVVHDGGMHRTKLDTALQERREMAIRYGLGRRLGGQSFWMWVARTMRSSGRPIVGTATAAYALLRFPRATVARLLGRPR